MATTPRQLIEQTTRHSVYFERLKSGEVSDFKQFAERMRQITVAKIADSDNLNGLTLKQVRRLESSLRNALEKPAEEFDKAWRDELLNIAQYESQFEARSLSQVARYNFDLPSATQLRAALFDNPMQLRGASGDLLIAPFVARWEQNTIDSAINAIRTGYATGQTNAQVIAAVRGTAEATGLFDIVDRSIETLVRTTMQHASQTARQATWQANSDIVKKVRILATLDDKTSVQCQSLDGSEWPIDSGPRPPFHPNCRTTTVPVLDERFAILDEGGTRVARDMEDKRKIDNINAKTTYYGWLKTQSPEIQDSIIGPTRGKLLRDGGLSAQRFAELQLGKRFEPITLEQMRKLEPLAFKRANI